jgi:hypothetical protein
MHQLKKTIIFFLIEQLCEHGHPTGMFLTGKKKRRKMSGKTVGRKTFLIITICSKAADFLLLRLIPNLMVVNPV